MYVGQNLQSHSDTISGQCWPWSLTPLCARQSLNAMHHSSWLLWQLKSSIPATFSEQTSCVQPNENTAPTTEKHWQRGLYIPKFRSHWRMRKRRRDSWAELWVILQRPGGLVYQKFSLDSGIIQWLMLSAGADYLQVNVLLNLLFESK